MTLADATVSAAGFLSVLAVVGLFYAFNRWSLLGRGRGFASATDDAGEQEPSDAEAEADEEHGLDDREHVHLLISGCDGPIRQSHIVKRTGWSKAKVSRLLSRMEGDGEINKIRIGRENLICHPGEEPDVARVE